jgi:hypothetical protein
MVHQSSLFSFAITFSAALATIDEHNFSASNVITKDVIIIGGGAAGSYAGVRLREDYNMNIALIELESELGGHVNTYTIPSSGETIEYGVQSYSPYGPALEFFKRFNIETEPFTSRPLTGLYVDYETSKILTGYTPPSANATNEALLRWLSIVERYSSLVEPGFWNFPSPEDIPADLLTPFGEFAKKHNVEAAVPRIALISNVGPNGLEKLLTLDVIQEFGLPLTQSIVTSKSLKPVGSNQLLYRRVLELLKKDVYLNAKVTETERTSSGIKVVVQGADDTTGPILIKAKRLLFTPPPRFNTMSKFDTDDKEAEVFSKMVATWRFAGVAHIPCIPENYGVTYTSSGAVPKNYLQIRDYAWNLAFTSTGPTGLGLFRVLFGGNTSYTIDEAKSFTQARVQDLVDAGSLNATAECKMDFKAFAEHNSVLWPGLAELKNGYVQKLNGLQGYRSTWWTGGKWCSDYTSNVWVFTDTVIDRLLKSLGKN